MKQKIKHNIILIGFMGCGKTSVGERLAKRLSYHFKDTDHIIEQEAGDTISNIFKSQGEEYFRTFETNTLQKLKSTLNNTILSTGGGLPMKTQNAEILQKLGYVVYLKASKDTIIQRLEDDKTRPLLADNLNEKVERLLSTRAPIYEKVANKIIATDGRTFNEIIDFIMEAYLRQIS